MVFPLREGRGGRQMKWKNLLNFAIAVLLLLNAVFGVFVYIRYMDENYYDKEIIENMTALLSRSDIVLEQKALSDKIAKLYTLRGTVSREKTAEALKYMSGTAAESDGDMLICRTENAVYTHDGIKAFSYRRSDIPEPDATGAVSVSNAERAGERAASAVWEFLSLGKLLSGSGKYKCELICRDILYSPSGGFFAAKLTMRIGGLDTDNTLTVYIRDETPLFIEGDLLLAMPEQALAAEEIGVLTVLLDEKAYVDALPEKKTRILSRISYSYIIWFDMKDNFYFTPICELCYESGEISRYDMITGERL